MRHMLADISKKQIRMPIKTMVICCAFLLACDLDHSTNSGGTGGAPGNPGSSTAAGADGEAESSSTSSGDAGVNEMEGGNCGGPAHRFITEAVAHSFGPGQDFGQDQFPQIIFGPPKGAGCCAGSLDVVSLGDGGSITAAFGDNGIIDGPGPDFVVFENPFNIGNDPQNPYAELATVEVSPDGMVWTAFPCTASSYPYGACAGWHPVYANPDLNAIDPTDAAAAGGDPFDLADIGVSSARYVRVTDRTNDGFVFDLDAISIVNALCP